MPAARADATSARLGTAAPDCARIDSTMVPMLTRRLASDLANLQLRPDAAVFVVTRLSFSGREQVAMALLRGDVDLAVKMLRGVSI